MFNNLHRCIPGCCYSIFYCNNNFGFVRCTSSSFTRSRSTEIIIIHFYDITQLIKTTPSLHRHSYLVYYQPCCGIADIDHFLETFSRTTSFIRTHQVYHPKPLFQWSSGLMKNCVGCQRFLISALCALKNLSFLHIIRFCTPTFWASEILRPAELFKMIKTIGFCPEFFLKLGKIDFLVVAHIHFQHKVLALILV